MAYIDHDGTAHPMRVHSEANGTGLIAAVSTTYAAAVATFGQVDYPDENGAPNVFNGWSIRTPYGDVTLYDYQADVRSEDGYRHDANPGDVLRYSVGGHRQHGAQAFACVVAALVKAGHPVKVID